MSEKPGGRLASELHKKLHDLREQEVEAVADWTIAFWKDASLPVSKKLEEGLWELLNENVY